MAQRSLKSLTIFSGTEESLRKESLWNIQGAEKDVFDTVLPLDLPQDRE